MAWSSAKGLEVVFKASFSCLHKRGRCGSSRCELTAFFFIEFQRESNGSTPRHQNHHTTSNASKRYAQILKRCLPVGLLPICGVGGRGELVYGGIGAAGEGRWTSGEATNWPRFKMAMSRSALPHTASRKGAKKSV